MTKNGERNVYWCAKDIRCLFYDDIVIIAPDADFRAYYSSILILGVVVVGVMIR